MQISEPEGRSQQLVDQLVCVWERSVRASHDFLGEKDIERIKGHVPRAILGVEHLVVASKDG